MVDRIEDHEKSPLRSKKLIAFLLAEITWKAILALALIVGLREGHVDAFMISSVALPIIIISGFVEALYIGGQAALDKYVRVAQIARGEPKDRPDGTDVR
jgi:hypothetical protein